MKNIIVSFIIFLFLLHPVLTNADELKLQKFIRDDKDQIEEVKLEFSGENFKYKAERGSPSSFYINIESDTDIENETGSSFYQPESSKVQSIFISGKGQNISIRFNLKANYQYQLSKDKNVLIVRILEALYEQPVVSKPAAEEQLSFDQRYQKWEDKLGSASEFFYRGFFLLTLNYANIEGNALSYSNGIFEFDEGLSSRQKLSFLGDGRIFDDYYLTVQAFYDPLDDSGFDYKPIRDLYFFARLEKGLNYISIGDHDKESFTNLYLNRYTQSFLGAEAHIEGSSIAATGIVAISKGGVEVQEFQADNTTGPFQLSRSPIVMGSEFVTIEERDKNSTSRVVNSTAQTRGVDYFINYEESEITFVTPVEKETFNRNPVFIVVRYQYERTGIGKEYITAAQVQSSPFKGGYLGATYINKFTDEGFELRDEVFGFHAGFDAGQPLQLFAEYSFSRNAASDTGEGGAYYLQMQGALGEKLRYHGSYQRIDNDFLNLANSRLKFYNNQIRIEGETIYNANENHILTLGYRSEEANIDHIDSNPAVTNSSFYGLWQINYPFLPLLTLRYDLVNRTDDNPEDSRTTDIETNEITVNAEQYFNFLGETGLQAVIRHSNTVDNTEVSPETNIDLYGAKVINRLIEGLMVFAEYRLERSELLDETASKTDYIIQGIGGRVTPFQTLNVDLQYEHRERINVPDDVKLLKENLVSVGAGYLLSTSLRLMGRYEEREVIDLFNQDSSQEARTANLKFYVNPLTNLRFGLGYEMEDRRLLSNENKRSYEDRLLIEGSYRNKNKLEIYARYQFDLNKEEFPPLPVTIMENTINLVGARFWIGEDFDFFGRYKKQRITGADDNTLETFTLEAGYQLFERYKFIIGFESAIFDHPTELADNYEAENLYLRFVGIL